LIKFLFRPIRPIPARAQPSRQLGVVARRPDQQLNRAAPIAWQMPGNREGRW
jgi:hypothetical protein